MLSIPSRQELRAKPLESDRLRLRPIELSDGADLFRAVSRSRAALAPWLSWVAFTTDVDSSERFAEACASDWDQQRALRLTIRDRETHQLLGVVGLESCLRLHRSCELGYWLETSSTGKGYITEASLRLLDFAFRQMDVHRVRVAAATTNHPSLRVITRLGFHFEGISRHAEWCDGRWLDHAVFGMLSSDFTTRAANPGQSTRGH